jgi:hypothetical protein
MQCWSTGRLSSMSGCQVCLLLCSLAIVAHQLLRLGGCQLCASYSSSCFFHTAAPLKGALPSCCTNKCCTFRDHATNCDPSAARTAAPLKRAPPGCWPSLGLRSTNQVKYAHFPQTMPKLIGISCLEPLFSGTGGAICSPAKVCSHRSLRIPEEPTWNWSQLSPMVPIMRTLGALLVPCSHRESCLMPRDVYTQWHIEISSGEWIIRSEMPNPP